MRVHRSERLRGGEGTADRCGALERHPGKREEEEKNVIESESTETLK